MVPNLFPRKPSPYRIAIIGEAPGADEVKLGEPFVGQSGKILNKGLAIAGVERDQCYFGNLSQIQPPNNEIHHFSWDGSEICGGLKQLTTDLETLNPNIVVLLGNTSLKLGKEPTKVHPLRANCFKYKISNWRGSLFIATEGPLKGRKCIATYHPAYALHSKGKKKGGDPSVLPLIQFDLRRAVAEATSPVLNLPQRSLVTGLNSNEIVDALYQINKAESKVGTDIEGYVGRMSCISFATTPTNAFIVPFFTKDHQPAVGMDWRVWRALAIVLENPKVPKVLQNSLYDRFILQFSYSIRVRNVLDIMLKHWELYCEIEKSLESQCSLYTREPYYKADVRSIDDDTFFRYCCRDSAVTLEIDNELELTGTSLDHYHFNLEMLEPLLYMELRGIAYNTPRAKTRRGEILNTLFNLQARLNGLTGRYVNSQKQIFDAARQLAFVRSAPTTFDEIARFSKKDNSVAAFRIAELMKNPNPTLTTLGELENLIDVSLNVDSHKQLGGFLYDELGLPEQFNDKEPPGRTTNYEALLKLAKFVLEKGDPRLVDIIQHCIDLRSLSTREQMLSIWADSDGRIRSGYNVVTSTTGRVGSYESPTGSGYNLQTIPTYDRDLFIAG